MRTLTLLGILFLLMIPTAWQAQDESESEYGSTIEWFYSACEDRLVVDFQGTMQDGYDLYYQAFDLFGGRGEPITALRRVSVNGDYAVTRQIHWLGRERRVLGTPISVVFRIARESNPDDAIFQEPSDDFLGACAEPGSSFGEDQELTTGGPVAGDMISSSGVFTPDGGLLNPIYYQEPEPIVQIGARPSERAVPGRTANPGLIFAECASVAGADPGVIYDTDEITVFWSWFAKTAEQVASHIANADYAIRLYGQPFPDVNVSEIKQIRGSRNWWVFYTVKLGDRWRPDRYEINFTLTWRNPITDGYDDYGPGTENPRIDSGCQFRVRNNPYGLEVMPVQPALPLHTYND